MARNSVLGLLGKFAAKQVPGLGLVMDGLDLVSEIVGGDTGKKIKDGINLVSEGINDAGNAPLTPEQQVQMEDVRAKKEVELQELVYKNKKLEYDDQAGGRDVIKTALLSEDPVVRQARPKMMTRLGIFAMIYTIATPLLIFNMAALGISAALIKLVTDLILWQGATLWGAFMTSFTGYTVARSADKKIAGLSEMGQNPTNLLKVLSKLGNKIS